MSLLNDALRDLERQKKPAGKPPRTKAAGTSAARSSTPKSKFVLPVLAVVAVVYYATIELNILGVLPTTPEASANVSPIALNQVWLERMEEAKKQKALALEALPEPDSEPTNLALMPSQNTHGERPSGTTAVVNSPLDDNLQQMHAAIKHGRLFEPESHNAWHYYEAALAIDPNNRVAQDGKQEIIDQLHHLFESAMLSRQSARAERYLASIQSIPALSDVYAKFQRQRVGEVRAVQLPASKPAMTQGPSTSEQVTKQSEQATKQSEQREPAKPVRPSLTDDFVAKQVMARPNRRSVAQAEKFILEQQNAFSSFVAVYQYYASNKNYHAMSKLASKLASHHENYAHFLNAHMLSLSKPAAAIEQLKTMTLPSEIDFLRKRLLAGLYQSQKSFDEAKLLYQDLVVSRHVVTNDWLGLAVSKDRIGDFSAAKAAYRQVLQRGHEDNRVLNFAQYRLNQLSANEGAAKL